GHSPLRLVFLLLARSPLRSPLFPYTTLFRSVLMPSHQERKAKAGCRRRHSPGNRGLASVVERARLVGHGHDHIRVPPTPPHGQRSEEHTSELQSLRHLVCRLLLEKKKHINTW